MPRRFKRVYIEISNVCNLQCTFCPEVERDQGFMNAALFQSVIETVAPLADEVCFHLMGEPLVHPEFDSYVSFCEAQGVRINLTTNGILLKPERYSVLLNPAIRQINFSLQSFADNFPDRDNSEYLGRLIGFTQMAMEKRPDLYLNYRLWNDGAEGAASSNASLVEQIRIGLRAEFNSYADVRWKKSVRMVQRVYLHFDSRFKWPHPNMPIRTQEGFCHALSSHIGILVDGTVVPCCLDKEGVMNLGNCKSQSLDSILASPRAQSIQKGFASGRLVEDLCQKCTFIGRFDRKVSQKRSARDRVGA